MKEEDFNIDEKLISKAEKEYEAEMQKTQIDRNESSVNVEAVVIWRYQIGQRVKRDNKIGKVINRYSKQSEVLDIFYPELYDVEWDDNQIEKSFLWHGLRAI